MRFKRGHKRTPLIPRLVPSDATRHVLDPKKKSPPEEEPAADASATPADPTKSGTSETVLLPAPDAKVGAAKVDTTKPGPWSRPTRRQASHRGVPWKRSASPRT